MHVEHHPLIKDFPELREILHEQRQSEEGSELLADPALNALKRQRVELKDEVAKRLSPPAPQCCGHCQG